VFAIAVPAMVANLTTPLLGIVATIAIGRRGDGVGDLRLPVLAVRLPAHEHGRLHSAGSRRRRGPRIARAAGAGLCCRRIDRRISHRTANSLAAGLFGAMGGSEGVTRAAKTYFAIRIWSAPLVLANYVVLGWLIGQARAALALSVQIAINVINMAGTMLLVLVLDTGIAGAALSTILAEAAGLVAGVLIARHLAGGLAVPRAALLDRAKLIRMMSVNRDIMIRTASLIAVWLFFTAQGARAGDVTLAANAVLNNFPGCGQRCWFTTSRAARCRRCAIRRC
jgi:MATE family multidrug resistance protein